MKHIHARSTYETTWFEDSVGGCAGLDLAVTKDNVTTPVGRITFWDAQGQFFLTLDAECPVEIVEALIAEARERILAA